MGEPVLQGKPMLWACSLLAIVSVSSLLYSEFAGSRQGRLAALKKKNRHLQMELARVQGLATQPCPPPSPAIEPGSVVNVAGSGSSALAGSSAPAAPEPADAERPAAPSGDSAPPPPPPPPAMPRPTASKTLQPVATKLPVLNGHVPVAEWTVHRGSRPTPDAVPLPTLKDRVPFADPDFGGCEPFTVANGHVHGKLDPSPADHVGTVLSGQVYVRCNRGFEVKLGVSPERVCVRRVAPLDPATLSSWVAAGTALDIGGNVVSRATRAEAAAQPAPAWVPSGSAWEDTICVASAPAMLTTTATYDQNQHLRCFERLVQTHPASGSPRRDHRVDALECLGCRRGSFNTLFGGSIHNCSASGRLFELADVDCTRAETLGSWGGGTYCILPRILSQPDPCVILTVGVGYIWDGVGNEDFY